MLKSKKFNIILAILVAIALWAFVLGDVNPDTTSTIRDIPVTFTNQDALEAEGLTIYQSSVQTVSIHINGRRNDVNRAEPGDFTVTCDVEGFREGENTARLVVSGPDNVEIDRLSEEKITVTVDKLVTAEKDIDVVINGEAGTDEEPYVVESSSQTVYVTGAETLVDRIAKVNASVAMDSVTGEMKTLTAELTPVDRDGNLIENVRLGQERINVTVVMLNTKTVDLEVPVENRTANGMERTVEVPKTIVIKGTEEAISGVDRITCLPVDIGDINENTTITLEPVLPEGVRLGNTSEGLSAKVTVKPMKSVTFTYDEGDLRLINQDASLKYSVSPVEITVEVTAAEDVINGLVKEDVTLTADVADLEEGTQTVNISASCDKGAEVLETSVNRVEITIE